MSLSLCLWISHTHTYTHTNTHTPSEGFSSKYCPLPSFQFSGQSKQFPSFSPRITYCSYTHFWYPEGLVPFPFRTGFYNGNSVSSLSFSFSHTHTVWNLCHKLFFQIVSQQPHSELKLSWVFGSLLVMNTLVFAQLIPSTESCFIRLFISHNLIPLQPRADWIRVDIWPLFWSYQTLSLEN